jgi:gluconolactonase
MTLLDNSRIDIIARDLEYPEAPVYCRDCSILLVEIKGERLTRITPDGERTRIARVPGGPNGLAVGPAQGNGAQLYVCNNGGMSWIPYPPPPCEPPPADYKSRLWVSGQQPQNYQGGRLQKVDLASGTVTDLFTETSVPPAYPPLPFKTWDPPYALRGPDDLVFDGEGGLWISDFGKQRPRDVDVTGIYYVSPDGKTMRQAIYPLNSPNGIALSPDGLWLYVALSYERRIVKYRIASGGVFEPNPKTLDGSYSVTGAMPGISVLDSMAVDSDGNLYVATMIPKGYDPTVNGGISIISPEGALIDFVEIILPDGNSCPLPSNICFGGEDLRTAYITCGGSGYLISMPSDIPGLPLKYNC